MSQIMLLRKLWLFACTCTLLGLGACSKNEAPTSALPAPDVAWVKPVAADMSPIFAAAKAQNKPMFLYWGAVWCPPCNQVKANVFKRADFIERSRSFIPVYIDGDAPGAQKLGQHFKVRGYPTMILLAPNGEELTRLPGEIEAEKYVAMLDLALQSPLSVKASLGLIEQGQAAQVGAKAWRQLAYYAWDQDQAQLVPADKLVPTLRALAKACPPQETDAANRLFLKSLVVGALESVKLSDRVPSAERFLALLQDPQQVRQSADVLINYGSELIEALASKQADDRRTLAQTLGRVLETLSNDARLNRADRLGALDTQLALLKLSSLSADESLKIRVRDAVRALEQQLVDPHERQALIPSAAGLLQKAGFWDEAQAMLLAELPKAVAPYYHMSVLSSLAKTRSQNEAALEWSRKAWEASQGPATRLQWGAAYVKYLIDLTPDKADQIESVAANVLKEVPATAETFYHRNRRVLERMNQGLNRWADKEKQTVALNRLLQQWSGVCTQLSDADEARQACSSAFKRLNS